MSMTVEEEEERGQEGEEEILKVSLSLTFSSFACLLHFDHFICLPALSLLPDLKKVL